jgi:hypothetical protein
VAAGHRRPRVPLLGDETIVAKAKQGRSRDRLDGAVNRRDRRPPVDRRAITRDDRLTKAAVGLDLVGERPPDVLVRRLTIAKRV